MFSSLSGIIGQPGQANYAGANTFMDAFAQFRTNQGLPASVINLGAVGDVGYISHDPALMKKMMATGFQHLREHEILQALGRAVLHNGPNPRAWDKRSSRVVYHDGFVMGLGATVPLDSPNCRVVWKKDRRMALYHSPGEEPRDGTTSSVTLTSYVATAKADPDILTSPGAAEFLANEIGKQLFALLLKPEASLNTSMSLTDLGMDSLVGTELRSWWRQAFGFDISVLEMLGKGTLGALGQHAAEQLLKLVAMEDKT